MAKSSTSGGIFHGSSKAPIAPKGAGTSASQGNAVGSGSRPVRSSIPLETGAADDVKTLGRAPGKDPDWLK